MDSVNTSTATNEASESRAQIPGLTEEEREKAAELIQVRCESYSQPVALYSWKRHRGRIADIVRDESFRAMD